jgi:putative transposase
MAVKECVKTMGIRRACSAFGLSRTAFYRNERGAMIEQPEEGAPPIPARRRPCSVPGRALTQREEQLVLDVLHSDAYVDKTPTEVYTALLDAGTYLCSIATMYRILEKHGEVKERRAQRRHTVYAAPELLATGVNQVWSWDITRLKGPRKWSYYQLYVIMDIFSRYIVGWMVAERESEHLAKDLIAQSILDQRVPKGHLTIHADRGSSMSSKTVAELLADLGVTKSQSRPRVSNDNPYSESQFRTLKYRPEFPGRFGSLEEARLVCKKLITWYNTQHYHSGIGFLTPVSVHYGLEQEILVRRAERLTAAYAAHPQRFVKREPTPQRLPSTVYINPPVGLPVQGTEGGVMPPEASRDASGGWTQIPGEVVNAAAA